MWQIRQLTQTEKQVLLLRELSQDPEPGNSQFKMACGTTPGLIAYGTLTTTIIVILSILLSKCGGPGTDLAACKSGGNYQENFDILSVDVSERQNDCKCETFAKFGFEVFEWIILSVLMITGLVGMIRLCYNWKNIQARWKARKAESLAKKYRKWQEQEAEATTSTKLELKLEPKLEPKKEPIFRYEAEQN